MDRPTELHPDYDRLCGINRDRNVPEYGEVVVPIIWLWDSPIRTKVIAVAEHGEPVKIIENFFFGDDGWDGRDYYHVQPDRAVFVGRLRRLRGWLEGVKPSGWIPATFLENEGRPARYDIFDSD